MNAEQLLSHIASIEQTGTGQYKVTITYRGKTYTGRTNNTLAIERLLVPAGRTPKCYYLTAKQAVQSLYNDVKRQNGL